MDMCPCILYDVLYLIMDVFLCTFVYVLCICNDQNVKWLVACLHLYVWCMYIHFRMVMSFEVWARVRNYVSVCMYACMHVCIYLSIYLSTHINRRRFQNNQKAPCMYTYVYVYVYVYVIMWCVIYIMAAVCMYICHVCTLTYIYIACRFIYADP